MMKILASAKTSGLTVSLACLLLAACSTPGGTKVRDNTNARCPINEVLVCRGGSSTRIEGEEPVAGEFCTCQSGDRPINY